MAYTVLAKVQLKSNSGLPRDSVEIDPVFTRTADATSTDFDHLRDDIKAFFHSTGTSQPAALEQYMAGDRDYGTNKSQIDFYRIPATPGPFGSPVATRNFTLQSPSAGQNLPEQDAVVLSFHGDLTDIPERSGSTRPASRRRGRLYLGPLNRGALESTASPGTAPQTVAADLQTSLGIAAASFFGAAAAAHGWTWVVFSRAAWNIPTVVGGYVDDRFDTQRRRLEAASGRTTFTV